jgi:hypothetical protein
MNVERYNCGPARGMQRKKRCGSNRINIFLERATPSSGRRLTTEATARKEDAMRKLAFAAAAAAALVVAVPASAQVYLGADPGGAGVQVGPFGFGVGPRYGYRDYGPEYYAYGSADCRVVRERIHTPSGQIVIKTRRVC